MEIINKRYKIGSRKLGTGGFAEVFIGVDMKTNKQVAIKKISLSQKSLRKDQVLEKLKLEIELMKKLNHVNIVGYYDVAKTNTDWYIVMEYCNAGTLDNVIKFNKEMNKKKLINFNREANTFYYLSQLKDALDYLRKEDHVHRDIKPMNILLTKDLNIDHDNYDDYGMKTSLDNFGAIFDSDEQLNKNIDITNFNPSEKIVLKLADFGLAKSCIENDDFLMKTLCGSPLYMAPELLMGSEYTSKADLWSYGIIMYELLFGEHPTLATSFPQLVSKIKSESINFHVEKNFTPQCFDLLKRLLVKHSDKRIEWDEFFNHEWFSYWKKVTKGLDPKPHSSQLDHSKELDNLNDKIVRRAASTPVKIDNLSKNLYNHISNYCNESIDLSTSDKNSLPKESSTGISPLSSSNLSKMKTNAMYSKSYTPGTYSDYPSSYPPSDPRRKQSQPLSVSVKRITSTDSNFFNSKKELTTTNFLDTGYSKSYGDSPQSRIFQHFMRKPNDSESEMNNDSRNIIDDYVSIIPKKSDPININKQSHPNGKL